MQYFKYTNQIIVLVFIKLIFMTNYAFDLNLTLLKIFIWKDKKLNFTMFYHISLSFYISPYQFLGFNTRKFRLLKFNLDVRYLCAHHIFATFDMINPFLIIEIPLNSSNNARIEVILWFPT